MKPDFTLKLLLVEDSPADARMIREALKGRDHNRFDLDQVGRLDEALALAQQTSFDEVLLDLGLPDSQGMETLTSAKQTYNDVPIVVLTGLDDRDFAVTTVAAGADDYLVKGQFDGELLIRTIRYAYERRRAEDKNRHLAAIIESCNEAIISKTLSGTIVSWNRGAERIFGYTGKEMIGQSITRLAVPGTEEQFSELLRRISAGEFVKRFETIRQRKDGSPVDVAISISPIKNTRGDIIAASTIAIDITEQKRAQHELARTNDELRRFNNVAAGRELRMIELKRQVNELSLALNRPAPYRLDFSSFETPPSGRDPAGPRSSASKSP